MLGEAFDLATKSFKVPLKIFAPLKFACRQARDSGAAAVVARRASDGRLLGLRLLIGVTLIRRKALLGRGAARPQGGSGGVSG
jgi:porphobilinogen deaminase